MRSGCANWMPSLVVWVVVFGFAMNQAPPAAQDRWWLDEPIRFLQTNLSETNSTVDPTALVAAVADFRREHVPDEHGRDRRAVSDAGRLPLSKHISCPPDAICSATSSGKRMRRAFAWSAGST